MFKQSEKPKFSGKKIMILIALAILVSSFAFANCHEGQKMEKMREFGKDKRIESERPLLTHRILSELDLSADQQDLIHDYRTDFAKKRINIMADIRVLSLEKSDMFRDKDFRKAKKKVEDIFQKKLELEKEKIDLREKVWKVLTKEQQEKFEQNCSFRSKPNKAPFHGDGDRKRSGRW